tara:strand:+ start:19850 stop:20746 length:897 start_codon:yes stop_codon:yes gene_type:complete
MDRLQWGVVMNQNGIILGVAAFFMGFAVYHFILSRTKRSGKGYNRALREKYNPDIFLHRDTVSFSSRQVNDLDPEERNQYEEREFARNQNITFLRLLVEDLFNDDDDPQKNEFDAAVNAQQRNDWIEHNEQPLNKHASLIQEEEIGSGMIILDKIDPKKDDLDKRIKREGGKNGEVQISLAWNDFNDLDLHLFCPSGERIYFNNKDSECGGELDVDMNVRPTSKNPVENIVWTEDAPLGKYKIGVHFYKHHKRKKSTATCKFRLRVKIHGIPRNYAGSITYGQAMQMVTSFTIIDPNE